MRCRDKSLRPQIGLAQAGLATPWAIMGDWSRSFHRAPLAYLQRRAAFPQSRRYDGSALEDGTVLIFSRIHAGMLD